MSLKQIQIWYTGLTQLIFTYGNHGNKMHLPDLEEDQYTYQDECQYTKGHNIENNYGHGTGCVKQGPETFHNAVFFLCEKER